MMKAVLKLLLLPLTLIVLFTQCEKDEPIPNVTISDNNFLNALIEQGVDTDRDGKISHAEAEVVISLDVSGDSISDMTGIEKFVNLDTLRCYNNKLTTLDVSNCPALSYLKCAWNKLTSLDVSNNTALSYLAFGRKQLTSLDVSNNTEVTLLNISEMPTLIEVCVWTIPFPPEGMHISTEGSPNVYFTTECSK